VYGRHSVPPSPTLQCHRSNLHLRTHNCSSVWQVKSLRDWTLVTTPSIDNTTSAWLIALLSNHVHMTTSLFEPITSYMYEHVHDQPGSHPLLPLIILQANNFPMYARTSISIYAFLLTLLLLQTYACDPCQQVGNRSSSLLSSRLPRACSFRSFS
jgi:hypothetical protein